MDWNCLFKTFRWKGLFIIYSIVHKGVYICSSTLLLEAAIYSFFPMLFLYWSVDIIILAQPAGEIACVPLCPATWKTTTVHPFCLFLAASGVSLSFSSQKLVSELVSACRYRWGNSGSLVHLNSMPSWEAQFIILTKATCLLVCEPLIWSSH